VRFRQCVVEYTSPLNNSRRPLWNALKYASSFPVIFLSAAQRLVVLDLVAEKGEVVKQEAWHGEHALFRLWYVSYIGTFAFLALIAKDEGYSLPSSTHCIRFGGT
jgi:EXS family